MNGLQYEYGGQVTVYTYDIDNPGNAGTAQQYGVRAIPTIVILDQYGNVESRFVGYTNADRLRSAIYNAMQ